MSRPKKTMEEPKEIKQHQEPQNSSDEIKFSNEGEKKEEIILVAPPSEKQLAKEKLAKLIVEESKMVKGRFRNYETPGANLRVQIRKYPGIPAFDKVLEDNKIYEIPLYVARHLNGVDRSSGSGNTKINSCAYPTHGFLYQDGKAPQNGLNDEGIAVPIIGVQKWNRRFGFESMEFDTEN